MFSEPTRKATMQKRCNHRMTSGEARGRPVQRPTGTMAAAQTQAEGQGWTGR